MLDAAMGVGLPRGIPNNWQPQRCGKLVRTKSTDAIDLVASSLAMFTYLLNIVKPMLLTKGR